MTIKIWDEDGEEIEKPADCEYVVNSVLNIAYNRHWRLRKHVGIRGQKYRYVDYRPGSFTIDIVGIGEK